MLDIKLIRENPDVVEKDLKKRGDADKLKVLHQLIKNDNDKRHFVGILDELRRQRNEASVEIANMKKARKNSDDKIEELGKISRSIKETEDKVAELEQSCRFALMRLPNILHDSVPVG